LAVVPLNLVPACADCNKAKLNQFPTNSQEEAIHPYFDTVDEQQWLEAQVVQGIPAAVVFSVVPPAQWGATLAARVLRQFQVLGLSALYTSHAAEELVNIRRLLTDLFAVAGSDAVRSHLIAIVDSLAAVRNNSWQLATYRALSADAWYCAGGFAHK
jgi:hypothetical protein